MGFLIMKVYVLTEHWWPESYGPPQSTIQGVYSCINDAEDKQNELISRIEDEEYIWHEYQITVQEFTINK